MEIGSSISPYIYWPYLALYACVLGLLAVGKAGLKGDLRYRIMRAIENTLGFFCFAVAMLAIACSDWNVVSWRHGVFSLKITTQVYPAGLALFFFVTMIVAVCTTVFVATHEYLVLPARLPKTFRKTRLIRRRSKQNSVS